MNTVTPAPVDVVFPCLNERAALPWVLGRVPAEWRAIVVDNGSTDGSGELAAQLGATVAFEPRRGFGAAVHCGLQAATAPFVAICDADGSLDPAELPGLLALLTHDGADLALGSRRPDRGAWPLHARLANRALAALLRAGSGLGLSDLGPMRIARTDALRGLRLADRRSGYPLEMVLRAAEAGWHVVEQPVRYAPRVGRSKVTGTVRGTATAVYDMATLLADSRSRARRRGHDAETRRSDDLTIAVVAKECLPGRVKTRLAPAFTPQEAADLASLSLRATLETVRSLPVRSRILYFDGSPATATIPGFSYVPQPDGSLDERLAALCDAVDGPLLILGMDTPQFTRADLAPLLAEWGCGVGGAATGGAPADGAGCAPADAWFGAAQDGGFWALALAEPDGRLILGVPMSQPDTGARQLGRLRRAGLTVRELPTLRDVDTPEDAAAVAAQLPGTEFSALVAGVLAATGAAR
ncbi:DUF2064 domain-containing protein [Sinomonas sp. P10A9]|uniref:DUF2064 domain-containing protein n=1 Tax=Sinomonas puerhi TaxID=3238584 RepID=A0AB39L2T1_9MICC